MVGCIEGLSIADPALRFEYATFLPASILLHQLFRFPAFVYLTLWKSNNDLGEGEAQDRPLTTSHAFWLISTTITVSPDTTHDNASLSAHSHSRPRGPVHVLEHRRYRNRWPVLLCLHLFRFSWRQSLVPAFLAESL